MGHGSEWIQKALKPPSISPLGVAVADLLYDFHHGLHHADPKQLAKIDWGHDHHILYLYYGGLATFDSDRLTLLVMLAFDYRLRLELDAKAHGYIEMMFHLRPSRTGGMWERLPTLEDHITLLRKYHPAPVLEVASDGK